MKYILPILLLIPQFASAQENRLVPCGYQGGPPCQACHIVELADNIVDFLIEIGTVLGVLMIIVGGFYLLSSGGNESQRSKGKGIITNVIIGFVIMLTAWFVVDVILKTFLDQKVFKSGPWNAIQCVEEKSSSSAADSESKKDSEKPVVTPAGDSETSSGTEGTQGQPNATPTNEIPRINTPSTIPGPTDSISPSL